MLESAQSAESSGSRPHKMPSLLSHIATNLEREFPGKQEFEVSCIRSQPRRSHALFPHATTSKHCKVYQEEVLCTLFVDECVPLCAIEASIYTVPSTSTSILYISKVDTTGLQSKSTTPSSPTSRTPNPTRNLVQSFIEFHLLHPPHDTKRIRIHVFAKSQPQYLFPGSIDNSPTKRVLDDKQLLRWWKQTLSLATDSTRTKSQLFYLVPGMTYLESLPYLPNPTPSPWTYGHPYTTLTSPVHPVSTSPRTVPLSDHIPAFPDDPKSRFLHALTCSSLNPSGTEGDYDDVYLQLHELTFVAGNQSNRQHRLVEIDKELVREQTRLNEGVEGGIEEWWERMGFRQECCSGVLVGFFVIGYDSIDESPTSPSPVPATSTTSPIPYPNALPHAVFTKLWTQFHNQDYSQPHLEPLKLAIEKWFQDVDRLVQLEIDNETVERGESKRHVTVDNHVDEDKKRERESTEKVVVNTLAPRKKKKKVE